MAVMTEKNAEQNSAEQTGEHYVAEYDRLERSRAGQSWFSPVRKSALAHFADQGFPTTHHNGDIPTCPRSRGRRSSWPGRRPRR